jgi:site-specific recombinase XerD
MVRTLFPRSGVKYEQSQFGRELNDFCLWLQKTGYSKDNIRGHLRRLFKVLSRARKLAPDDTRSSAVLHHVFGRYCTTVSVAQNFRGTEHAYCRFLRTQNRLREGVLPREFELVLRYRNYLEEVRGFSNTTVGHHEQTVSDFIRRVQLTVQKLGKLTSDHIEQYLADKSKHNTRQSMQHVIAHLRAFLRYGIARGLVRQGVDVIDTPRTYRDELPPRAMPWTLVKKLLRSVDRSSKAGWRDYMILHLMAYYGLRASEIAALRIDAIDWESKTCRVEQRKTQSDLVLPLSDRTLALLRRYLRCGRPHSPLPQLFVRARRPAGILRHYGVCDVFYTRAARSGLPLDGYSSYSLRHSFAMRLLQRGVGVKAIGDLLGHHSLEATCVYLRLDMSALRSVALPVPTNSRSPLRA